LQSPKGENKADLSEFGTMLFLPDGYRIVTQLVNGMSGDRLLELIGGDVMSVDDFMCIFFPEEYFARDIDEVPTLEQVANCTRAECEIFPGNLPEREFNELIDAVSQATIDAYADKDQRKQFENQLRSVADLIVGKLPPPNEKNREYRDNICRGVEAMIDESHRANGDGEEKLERAREMFPKLGLSFS
jgi:hypothetical protein